MIKNPVAFLAFVLLQPLLILPAYGVTRKTIPSFAVPVTDWSKIDINSIKFNGNLYRVKGSKRPQFVHIQSLNIKGSTFSKYLQSHTDEVQERRGKFLGIYGIRKYFIQGHEIKKSPFAEFGKMSQLHAQFRDAQGKYYHVIERQYVKGNKAFIVSYIDQVPSLTAADYERINKSLDLFKPASFGSRASLLPASFEKIASFIIPSADADTTDVVSGGPSSSPSSAVNDQSAPDTLHFQADNSSSACQDVPAADRRDTKALHVLTADDFKDCPDAAKKGVVELGQVLGKIDKATTSDQLGQTMAGMGSAAASAASHPVDTVKHVASGIYNFVKDELVATHKFFNCLNARATIRGLCEAAPSLAGAVAGKLLAGGTIEKKAVEDIAKKLDETVAKGAATETEKGVIDLQKAPQTFAGDTSEYQKAPKVLYSVDQGAQMGDLPPSVQKALANNMDGVPEDKLASQVSDMSSRDSNRYIVMEQNNQGDWGAYIPGQKQANQFGQLTDLSPEQASATESTFSGVPLCQGQQCGTAQMVDVSALGWQPGQQIVPAWGGSQTVGPTGSYAVVNANGAIEYIVQRSNSGLPVGYIPK